MEIFNNVSANKRVRSVVDFTVRQVSIDRPDADSKLKARLVINKMKQKTCVPSHKEDYKTAIANMEAIYNETFNA